MQHHDAAARRSDYTYEPRGIMSNGELSTKSWTSIGPHPLHNSGSVSTMSGRINGAGTNPVTTELLCIAADAGGIWSSEDAANPVPKWEPRSDALPSLISNSYHPVAVHPGAADMFVAGMIWPSNGPQNGGVLLTTDRGKHWKTLASSQLASATWISVALNPSDADVIYASGGTLGVFKSTDRGANWTKLTALPSGFVSDLILDRGDPSGKILYASVVQGSHNGIYKSSDAGHTWHAVMTGLPAASQLSSASICLDSGPGRGFIYAAILVRQDTSDAAVLRFRTVNGGTSWTKLSPTPGTVELRQWHLALGVDPLNAEHVIVNDAYSLYESTDGGGSWTQADASASWKSFHNGFDWCGIAFDALGGALCMADQGIFRYNPSDQSWRSLVGNLAVSELYTMALDHSDAGTVYAVGQDLGSLKRTSSAGWHVLDAGIGEIGKVIVHPSNSSLLYGYNPLSGGSMVMRSTDAGTTWSTIYSTSAYTSSPSNADNTDYGRAEVTQNALVMDPADSERLLFGTDRVFSTLHASVPNPTWTAISPVFAANQWISTLTIAPSHGTVIYAATIDGHVHRTTNSGSSWALVDTGLTTRSRSPTAGSGS
jgi:photosystem II stability/assembly factor-like uncharacterized protein